MARAQGNQRSAPKPAPDSQQSTVSDSSRGSAVVFRNDTLFTLYGHLGPFSASSRATAVTERLRQAAPGIVAGDSVAITDHENYSELGVRDIVIMTVLDADAAPLSLDRATLARKYAARIRTVVVADAKLMTTRALIVDTTYAVAATIVLLFVLKLISLGFARLYTRLDSMQKARLSAVRIQRFELLSAGRLATLLTGLARAVRVFVTLVLFYIYIPLVLSFFPWTASLSQRIIGYALIPFAVAWMGFIQYLPKLFYLAAGIVIVRYLLAFVHMIFGALGTGAITARGFYADWAEPTYKIIRVIILMLAATVLYPYLPGASSDAFKGVSIFVGVLFSLGSSSAIGNMVAGVVLTYTRAFQIGDRVQIADTVGDVIEKTLLVTRLRTIKNVAVTIPNGTVLSSHVINFTTLVRPDGLILHTTVTIGYDAPWRDVHKLLVDAATRTEHILAEPVPFVLQTSLDDFYVSYQINATTDRPDIMAMTYSELHKNIQEAFNEGGVEIMSAHYSSLRDGNQSTIPSAHRGRDHATPAFRVMSVPPDSGDPNAGSES